VTASASGITVTLTAKTTGDTTNYSLSSGASTNYSTYFSSPSFSVSVSGANLTGGTSPGDLSSGTYTAYAYDAGGNLSAVTQGVQTRTNTYDGLGRVTSYSIPETTPTGGSQQTTYLYYTTSGGTLCSGDPSAVCRRTDARGVITTYSYDALNRPTQISYNVGSTGVPSTSTVSYAYDSGGSSAYAIGRLTSMTDGVGSESYTYDQIGRVTQVQKVIGSATYTTGYAYNAGSQLSQITYPSGSTVVVQSYDAIGRLCSVGASSSSCTSGTRYAYGFTYNAPQQVTGFTYANGVAANFGYSASRLQMTSLAYSKSSTTLFGLNYYYGYDSNYCPTGATGNNGQIQCIKDTVQSVRSTSYNYDSLGRLSTGATAGGSSAYPQWGFSWTYDRYGNRTNQNVTAGSGPGPSPSVSTSTNQIVSLGGVNFSYDANGNLTQDDLFQYTPDAENHVVTLKNSTGTAIAQYAYDGNGLRVEKCLTTSTCSSATSATVYIFSGSKVIAEYDNGAAPSLPTRQYIYAGGQLLATMTSSGSQYHHRDHLSARLTTDSSGSIIGEQGHYPFGDPWYDINTTTKWKFTTYERDPESGTGSPAGNDYAGARYYLNRLGRFPSTDPLPGSTSSPQSLNRYGYSLNDPINMADPSGADAVQNPQTGLCINDAYFGVMACGDLCAGKSSASCDETGGGGSSFGFNIDFSDIGTPGSWGESGGIPYGTTIEDLLQIARATIFKGCEFGPCLSGLGFQDGNPYLDSNWEPCVHTVFDPSCRIPTCPEFFLHFMGKAWDILPQFPTGQTPEDAVKDYSFLKAMSYAAGRLLTYPLKSSVVRGILQAGEEAAGYVAAAPLLATEFYGLSKELQAWWKGNCRTIWSK
jgi:RHS repeat-associated protein